MQYPRIVQVAAVQMTTTLDKQANRKLAEAAVREAARNGADLVVLPEATMCSFGEPTTDLGSLAEPIDGPFVSQLLRVASATGTVVVAGMFETAEPIGPSDAVETAEPIGPSDAAERAESIGPSDAVERAESIGPSDAVETEASDRVHNTVVAVGPGGFIGRYRKFHLYDALGWRESDRIVAGDPAEGPLVFPLQDMVVGVMNCYDLRFPEMARSLVDAGATVLVEPANWINGPGKAETWTILLRARAIESTAYVVAAAKPGPECAGHSMIVDPLGEVLASFGGTEIGQLVAELSADQVTDVRQAIPVLENRRFDVRPRTGAPASSA